MPKNPHATWTSTKGGPKMRNGWYMKGTDKISQEFYFPDNHPEMPGWFKGMEIIICFSQSLDHWMPNVRASSTFLARSTAVHTISCSASQISTCRSCILRNTSRQEVTFVTFTTTASSISLSSTGVQPSFITSHHHWLQISMPWRRMLLHASMMFLCSRLNGRISSLPW